ncbi:MAG: hypothetical protein Q8Q49_05190, partial [bacterium]|nr:hypothetical protein [bacterium]
MIRDGVLLALLRIGMGCVFLWAFLDKVFGLGFATTQDKSWLMGVSPTSGFLQFGTKGMFASSFHTLSGNVAVDWLFMLGLLGVGVAFTFGIGMKIASYAGSLMMLLIYLSLFPPANNPLIDEHIIYILVLLYLGQADLRVWSLQNWWMSMGIIKRYPL